MLASATISRETGGEEQERERESSVPRSPRRLARAVSQARGARYIYECCVWNTRRPRRRRCDRLIYNIAGEDARTHDPARDMTAGRTCGTSFAGKTQFARGQEARTFISELVSRRAYRDERDFPQSRGSYAAGLETERDRESGKADDMQKNSFVYLGIPNARCAVV